MRSALLDVDVVIAVVAVVAVQIFHLEPSLDSERRHDVLNNNSQPQEEMLNGRRRLGVLLRK